MPASPTARLRKKQPNNSGPPPPDRSSIVFHSSCAARTELGGTGGRRERCSSTTRRATHYGLDLATANHTCLPGHCYHWRFSDADLWQLSRQKRNRRPQTQAATFLMRLHREAVRRRVRSFRSAYPMVRQALEAFSQHKLPLWRSRCNFPAGARF